MHTEIEFPNINVLSTRRQTPDVSERLKKTDKRIGGSGTFVDGGRASVSRLSSFVFAVDDAV